MSSMEFFPIEGGGLRVMKPMRYILTAPCTYMYALCHAHVIILDIIEVVHMRA